MLFKTHDKYLLRQYVNAFSISVFAFVVIYVTVDVFEEIDNFIDKKASIIDVTKYYLFSIPFILTYVIPVSLLLATIFSMGVMARRNELTALMASGVSLLRITAPVLGTAILVSIGSAYFNDVVVARANRNKHNVMRYNIEKHQRQDPDVKENLHYLGDNGRLYLAKSYRHASQTLYDVVVQDFANNTLLRRVDARKAQWEDSVWVFHNGFIRDFSETGESSRAFDRLPFPNMTERPNDFAKEDIDEENMTFVELRAYIDKVRRTGGNVEKYVVDMWFKLSYPFAGSIFVLIGIAFSSGRRKQSVATGFGVTLVVAFIYYAVLRVGQTLGHNGVIPPLLAAQLGNIIFFIIGMILMYRAAR